MMKRLLLLKQVPFAPNLALLLLRLGAFSVLFLKHGAEKVFTFSDMLVRYRANPQHLDPLHIGAFPTLVIVLISDGICSTLVMLGLATRWASLFMFCNLFVVWSVVDGFVTVKRGGLTAGEPVALYLACCVLLFLTGPGKFSLDALIDRSER